MQHQFTMKKGDAIATVAQPIARTIDWFFGTNVARCAACRQMHYNLNAGMTFGQANYDRFCPSSNNNITLLRQGYGGQAGDNTMQFIITKQIAVEAETPEEAFTKIAEGTTISVSVNARPQPQ